jgi:3-oxoacyl-[acyl-carrier protein] reductase
VGSIQRLAYRLVDSKLASKGAAMFLERLRLDGQVAVVIGAAPGGMGGITARAIAEAGAAVSVVDIREDIGAMVLADIEAAGGRAGAITADATDTRDVRAAFDAAMQQFGPPTCLINVAGGTRPETWARLEETDDEVMEATLALNFGAMFRCCREGAQRMIAAGAGGSIVNFASISGLRAAPYHATYGAAKAAVMAMTQSMANEWGEHGIRVNAIAPGRVSTERTRSMTGLQWDRDSVQTLPGDLPGADIASVVLFLLSDLAASVTGQTIVVDRGVVAGHPMGGREIFAARAATPRS